MCGRFTQAFEDWSIVLNYFGVVDNGFRYPARYNVAPTQDVAAIVSDGRERRIGLLKWGLIHPWVQSAKSNIRPINARAETLLVNRRFRDLVPKKRCIIPADGFYEWQRNTKRPYRIRLKKRQVFAFAGIYDTWRGPDGQKVSSFAIITCAPNQFMWNIHDRMPVILDEAGVDLWLDRSVTDPELVTSVLRPTDEEMYAYPVNPMVGNVRNDGPKCVEEYHG
ncbi:SOS response-associated peptidase [Alicyclobacillus kakegawensis]|uniref:SOS response-associated peptidase n=1 Tax=Alicyclobacillus kakegawensis TaxID=392012 RepID=UPI00082DB2C6|nr:SOS response-associated peptidase [Alicyclobacillus kakegawensis]